MYYHEDVHSSFTHLAVHYQLNKLLYLMRDVQPVFYPTAQLTWILEHSILYEDKVLIADISVPILVYDDPIYGYTVLDGVHHLTRAVREHLDYIPIKLVTREQLDSCKY